MSERRKANGKYWTYCACTNPPRRRCKFRSWGCSEAYGLRARDWRPFEDWPHRRDWRPASPVTLNYSCSTYCFYLPFLLLFWSIPIAIFLYQWPIRIHHFSLSCPYFAHAVALHARFHPSPFHSRDYTRIFTPPDRIRSFEANFARNVAYVRKRDHCEFVDRRYSFSRWNLFRILRANSRPFRYYIDIEAKFLMEFLTSHRSIFRNFHRDKKAILESRTDSKRFRSSYRYFSSSQRVVYESRTNCLRLTLHRYTKLSW